MQWIFLCKVANPILHPVSVLSNPCLSSLQKLALHQPLIGDLIHHLVLTPLSLILNNLSLLEFSHPHLAAY
eukprot:scaffold3411_cov190-Chaetoceros_neogracile.AAC.6